MLLIIEIALTLLANKRGWGRLAFLPLACALMTGAILGSIAVGSGIETSTLTPISLIGDGLLILCLSVMIIVGKKQGEGVQVTKAVHQKSDASGAATA